MARLSEPATVPSPHASHRSARRSVIGPLIASLRPEQWTKNLLVFAGILFGGRLTDGGAIAAAVLAFAVFCVLSGVVYLFNDLMDRHTDQRHPLKRLRPIASGALHPKAAFAAGVALSVAALSAALFISAAFAAVSATYVVLLVLYSIALKHMVILDVLTIAAGFVLRAVAGALAVEVPISQWLLICTVLLALFLALSKRRHELVLLEEGATEHRPILGEYSPYLLDQMIAVVTASTLIAYTTYATSADTAARLGTHYLGLTVPFVLYGIFRYLYLVHQKRGGGSPAALLVTDRPLLACVALWGLSVACVLYLPFGF